MSLNYILRAKKFRTKKSLGQNFLIDKDTIDFIADFVSPDDEVLEIGAGIGFVTEQLVKKAKNVVAVEIDKDAIDTLNNNFSNCDNFKLIENDILKTELAELPFKADKIKIIGNIPYYITSPIIAHLLGEIDDINNSNRNKASEILLMVQLEVAQRIVANETSSNKEYGMLSILSQMYCDTQIVKIVPKDCFSPAPKVDSAIVKFKINEKPRVEPTRLLRPVVKALFNQRRKNIKNSLTNAGFREVQTVLSSLQIDEKLRGEKLSIKTIQQIAKELEEFN